MDKEEVLELIKDDIRDKIFGQFKGGKIDEGLNKSRFKEAVEKILKEQYKDTGVKFDLVWEGDKIILKPYAEHITLQIEI